MTPCDLSYSITWSGIDEMSREPSGFVNVRISDLTSSGNEFNACCCDGLGFMLDAD